VKKDSYSRFRIVNLRAWGLIFGVFVLMLLPSACIFPKKVTVRQRPLPAAEMTTAEVLQTLDDSGTAVETLTASGEFRVTGGALKEFQATEAEASGILVVERPDRIHVQIKVLGVTVADMVAAGNEYKMRLPRTNEFFVGLSNAPTTSDKWVENIRPKHIQDALFVNALPYRTDPRVKYVIEQDTKDQRSYYVIDFLEDTGSGAFEKRQRIWIDRYDKQVARKKIYRGDGRIEADVEYLDYQTFCGVAFPRTVVMRRPLDDYELKITLTNDKIRLNEQISEDKFFLAPQPGDKIKQRDAGVAPIAR
jgi:outer membrane lipoprotein-sorting protein